MQISDLNPADYNPRKITEEELQRLKQALEKLGDLSGIVENNFSGNLIGGHQRIKVLPADAPIEIINHYDPPTRTGSSRG